ncbi:MAG TPA: hypothetical protein VKC99_07555 [Methyloceanibacter sp.]|nr:hypothetical protein [Methyloceanibacter sp.]
MLNCDRVRLHTLRGATGFGGCHRDALALAWVSADDLVFFLASFHADIVFGLACLCRIVFRAGLLLLATLLATVRLFSTAVMLQKLGRTMIVAAANGMAILLSMQPNDLTA